jgi:TldD protein
VERDLLTDLAEKAIKMAVDMGAEYADARAERIYATSIRLSNERFEQATSGLDQGIGVRTLYKGAWGFSSTTSLELKEIKATVENAFKTARATSNAVKEKVKIHEAKVVKDHVKVRTSQPLAQTGIDKKLKLLLHLSKIARDYSPKIVSANLSYEDGAGQKVVISSDGANVLTDTSRVYTAINAVAKEGEKITSCRERLAKPGGFELFQQTDADRIFERASGRAVSLLKAEPAPSGRYTVIADPHLAGVFAHEAVGHGCEADGVIAGESILEGKLGKKVGSEIVTILDDSTVEGAWGTEKYDDEGVPTKKRMLIEKGILKGYIHDRETAAKLNMEPNGGARVENFSHRPVVRMSNTYIAKGDYTFEELLEDIDKGVYLKASRGGQVDTAKGTFQFNAEEAYRIQKGKLITPLLDVSLSGLTLETLHNIDAIGKDFDWGTGFCGKAGQSVPVGNASPHVRIKNALIGGRA